jgi:Ni/Co efflux regulator RcnB
MNKMMLAICAVSVALAGAPSMAASGGGVRLQDVPRVSDMIRVADNGHGKKDKHKGKGHDDRRHDKRDDRRDDRRDYRHDARDGDRGRHLGWTRGDRVTRDRYVVIERYRDYGYRAPPRGYQYVEIDGDVLMIAIATGVIFQILSTR